MSILRFFGEFLIESGQIDADHLRQALELTGRSNPRLGDLAVEQGWLSGEQTAEINSLQDFRNRSFGDVAIDLALLSSGQVETLVRKQQQGRLQIGAALVRLGHLTESQLDRSLDEFKSEQPPAEVSRSGLPDELAENPIAECVLEILPRFLRQVARTELKIDRGVPFDAARSFPYASRGVICGAPGIEVGLAGDAGFMQQLLANAAGCDSNSIDKELIEQVVSEILNMMALNVVMELDGRGVVTGVEIPSGDVEFAEGTAFEIVFPNGAGVLILKSC